MAGINFLEECENFRASTLWWFRNQLEIHVVHERTVGAIWTIGFIKLPKDDSFTVSISIGEQYCLIGNVCRFYILHHRHRNFMNNLSWMTFHIRETIWLSKHFTSDFNVSCYSTVNQTSWRYVKSTNNFRSAHFFSFKFLLPETWSLPIQMQPPSTWCSWCPQCIGTCPHVHPIYWKGDGTFV